jgi:DNA-binding CsgD family transcriptional regulator
MARKRVGSVKESLEELRSLEEHYRGKPEQNRIGVLRLLKEDPERGIEDVALHVGYSAPTVKRWWRAYREGGMEGLIEYSAGSKRANAPDVGINSLKQMLSAGQFNKIEDVRTWIDSLILSRQEKLLGSEHLHPKHSVAGRIDGSRNGIRSETPTIAGELGGLTERLLRFLSSLSSSHTVTEWSDAFRKALQMLLGDVDRVSITVNVRCDLLNPQGYQPNLIISQSVHTGATAANRLNETTAEDKNGKDHLERVLDSLRGSKFPFSDYHAPVHFVYHHLGSAFIGVIVLWRERSKTPLSAQSVTTMERLHPFMEFLLSDFVARYQVANPVEHVFDLALEGLTRKTGLTIQERRIMVLQLLGLSYDEVATSLSISLNTVRYHLRSIYQKTGTHSLAELFAKYFTPKIDSNQSQE